MIGWMIARRKGSRPNQAHSFKHFFTDLIASSNMLIDSQYAHSGQVPRYKFACDMRRLTPTKGNFVLQLCAIILCYVGKFFHGFIWDDWQQILCILSTVSNCQCLKDFGRLYGRFIGNPNLTRIVASLAEATLTLKESNIYCSNRLHKGHWYKHDSEPALKLVSNPR